MNKRTFSYAYQFFYQRFKRLLQWTDIEWTQTLWVYGRGCKAL